VCDSLRKVIFREPILKLPRFGEEFVLCTDASGDGIGASLMQENDGMKFPIIYISRKLNRAERNYSVIERECLVITWAIRKLHMYLYGREFTLETDHEPLMYINRHKMENGWIMRWALTLQAYKFKVEVVKGKDNVVADFLSRCAITIGTL
jgi:hypothetical protein